MSDTAISIYHPNADPRVMSPDQARMAVSHWRWQTVELERQLSATRAELAEAREAAERLEDALEDIRQWADAYPTDIFPEPDFQRAHAVLTAAGMTLDAISAAVMRRAVERIGKIARAALAPRTEETTDD